MMIQTPNAPYRVCDIPGKGSGLVSATCLKPGQMIISEPFLLYLLLPGGNVGHKSVMDLSRQFSEFDQSKRELMLGLANVWEHEENQLLGIFKTNAMMIGDEKSGIFPTICRANHACVPNCNYVYNEETGKQELFVIRPILPCEEITVSYLPDNLFGGRAIRRKRLLETHNFDCLCDVCKYENGEDEEDRKLAVIMIGKINSIGAKIPLTLDKSVQENLPKYEYLSQCTSLYNHIRSMYVNPTSVYLVMVQLFQISVLLEMVDETVSWASKIHQVAKILSGAASEESQSWEDTARNWRLYARNHEAILETINQWTMQI